MVGVPGRSKGCHTCRRRRVKCDETKPTCLRCVKAGYVCQGYERQRTWLNASTAPFPMTPVDVQDAPLGTRVDVSLMRRTGRVQSPPPEMSLVAFQGEFCFSFMFANVVWRSYGVPWLDQAAGGKLGHLSLGATTALAQANFGKSNHMPDMEVRGLAQYGRCLRMLVGDLSRGQARDASLRDLLVPILVLLMQAASRADRAGCISHMKGLSQVLYMCGPEPFQEQPYLNAFESARSTMLIAGLIGKQRVFLEDQKWLTLPWAIDPAAKTPQSQLFDILMPVPGMLEDHATDEATPHPDPDKRARILERAEIQLITLFRWRWTWQATSGHLVSVEEDSDQPTTAMPRRRRRLRFGRFLAATEIMAYNAALMWLMALLWKLDPLGAGNRIEVCGMASRPSGDENPWDQDFGGLRRPGVTLSIFDPALEVCQTYEWISRHHGANKDPAWLYLFPMGMAMSVIESDVELSSWARGLLDSSPVTANYARGGNPAGFGFYVTRESLHPEMVHAEQSLFSPGDAQRNH